MLHFYTTGSAGLFTPASHKHVRNAWPYDVRTAVTSLGCRNFLQFLYNFMRPPCIGGLSLAEPSLSSTWLSVRTEKETKSPIAYLLNSVSVNIWYTKYIFGIFLRSLHKNFNKQAGKSSYALMVNLMCQPDWAKGCPTAGETLLWVCLWGRSRRD